MRVLFTTNIPSPYRVDFFNELSKYCELTVLFERKTAKDRNSDWLNSKKMCFTAKYLKGINIGNDSAVCPEVLKYLNKEKFDIIVIGGYSTPTNMFAIQVLKMKKIKFILNCDGGIIKKDSILKYKIKKYFISKAEAYLSTGKKNDDYLMHYGVNKKNIYRYPFTSLSEHDILSKVKTLQEKSKIKKMIGITEKKVILSIGQFIYRKGYDILLKATETISKDIGIYIVGGIAPKEYLDLKTKLNLNNVHFIDFKQKDEIKYYFLSADVFTLPTREDIWGLVINEAMAFGLPVITTDNCLAGVELIEDGLNGYIVPIEDCKELADKINELLDNSNLNSEISKNNLTKIKEYTIEKMAKQHIAIFKKLLKE